MEITTRQLIEWKFEGAINQKAYEGDSIYFPLQQKNVKLMGYGKNGNNISNQGFLEVQDLETSVLIGTFSATHFLAKRPIDAEGTTTATTPTNQTAATKTTTNRSSVKKSEEPLWATVVE